MKYKLLIILLAYYSGDALGQELYGLEVEGWSAKIDGRLSIGDSISGNIFIGYNSGNFGSTTPSALNNIFIGNNAGSFHTSGERNTFIGESTGLQNQTGSNNTFIGMLSGTANKFGRRNTFLGNSSGYSNIYGDDNVYIGTQTAFNNTTGNNNVFIGFNAGFNELTSNKLYIENSRNNDPLIYGEFDNDLVKINGTLQITKIDTISTHQGSSSSTMVRMPDGKLGVRHYKIGDFIQGGMIFWIDETGEHGIVVDTSDLSNNVSWYNDSLKVTNANGNGIGAGEMNTLLIISQQTSDNPSGSFAALLCAQSSKFGFGDWYLPSIVELELIYNNLHVPGLMTLSHDLYWSSTECSSNLAWDFSLLNNKAFCIFQKSNPFRVRAVRRF